MKKTFVKVLSMALVAVMLVMALVSCGGPASDPDKAKANLEKKDYGVVKDTVAQPAAIKLLTGVNVDAVVTGTKTVEDKDGNRKLETVTIYYFTEKADAKTAYDKLTSDKEKNKSDSDWVFKQSGKIVYFGTKAACKAAG